VVLPGVAGRAAKLQQRAFLGQEEQLLDLHAQFLDGDVVDLDVGYALP
jgi:hypothetical protein